MIQCPGDGQPIFSNTTDNAYINVLTDLFESPHRAAPLQSRISATPQYESDLPPRNSSPAISSLKACC